MKEKERAWYLYDGMIYFIATMAVLIPAAIMDLYTERIDNRLLVAGLAAGILLQFLTGFPHGIWNVAGGILVPVILCWVLFRMHGLGAGDIKLLAVVGSINGLHTLLLCMVLTFMAGAAWSFFALLYRHQMKAAFSDLFLYFQKISKDKKISAYNGSWNEKRRMHFSVAILYGFLLTRLEVILWGNI